MILNTRFADLLIWFPSKRTKANCAFTTQHQNPNIAQTQGAPAIAGLGLLNSGLLIMNPSQGVYDKIVEQLASPATLQYAFPDQDLLGDVFKGRWVALPYIYNALKTLRWEGVHDAIWRDKHVKNVHYILSPKPWDQVAVEGTTQNGQRSDPSHAWWTTLNAERLDEEQQRSLADGF